MRTLNTTEAVVFEITGGGGMCLAAAAATLPPTQLGKPVTASVLWRWATAGVVSPAGRVQLETARLGHRLLTTREALKRFITRQNAITDPASEPTPASAPKKAKRSGRTASAVLDAAGI